jgi:hypothetical protein
LQDVRTPCPESHLAARNARILCPKNQIDRTTEFHKRVQAFRSERALKNQTGEVSVKLYIPGRIIHLVDTKGDEKKYVPYWGSRYEFNQVILSKRMLADHDILSLPDLLGNINLDECHEVNAWVINDHDADEEDIQLSFIVPCSNPQGKLPILLSVFIVMASILASLSNRGCEFANIYFMDFSLNVGVWSYNLLQCADGELCDDPAFYNVTYVASDYCMPYSHDIPPDSYWVTAQVFGSSTVLLGLVGLIPISSAICVGLKRRTWLLLCAWFLMVTLFQSLQFLFLKSDLFNDFQSRIISHGFMGIGATVIWFMTAVGCSHMARRMKSV